MTSNNIYIFSTENLYKGNSAGSFRMMNYAKALSLAGCKTFFCSFQYENIDLLHKVNDHISYFGKEVKAQRNGIFRQITLPLKIFNSIRTLYTISKRISGEKVFLLYPSTKISIEFFSIVYLKFIKKQKVFLETNEVRKFDNMFSKSKSSESVKRQLYLNVVRLKFIVNEFFKPYFDGLICISTNIENYYKKKNKNILRVPILCNDPQTNNNDNMIFNKPDKFFICFTGWVAIEKDNLDLFLKSLAEFKKSYSNFEFHLYGKINKVNEEIFNKIVMELKLQENVFYKDFVKQEELPLIIKKYHLLVIPRGYNLQNHYGFSTKLSEYIISGVPFLITDVSDNGKFIKDNINGFIVPPDNVEKMTEKLLYIIENYNNIVPQIIFNAKKTALKNFHYANYSDNLKNFLFPNTLAN